MLVERFLRSRKEESVSRHHCRTFARSNGECSAQGRSPSKAVSDVSDPLADIRFQLLPSEHVGGVAVVLLLRSLKTAVPSVATIVCASSK